MSDLSQTLETQLRNLPQSPGVYQFFNDDKVIIYIGKAKNLKNRVLSYFRSKKQSYKVERLSSSVAELKYILTDTEVEALLLESHLIKKHQPYYNIDLKDGSSFPYLKLTVKDEYPGLFMTRAVKQDGNLYFGPFVQVRALRSLVSELNRLLQLRSCVSFPRNRTSPCLEFDMGHCGGYCCDVTRKADYQKSIQWLKQVLSKRTFEIRQILTERMRTYAAGFEFEKAESIKNILQSLSMLFQKQKVVLPDCGDIDIFVAVQSSAVLLVEHFFIRDGSLSGHSFQQLDNVSDGESDAAFLHLIERHYLDERGMIPETILLNRLPGEIDIFQSWIRSRRAGCRVAVPQTGIKKRYVDLLEKNALNRLSRFQNNREAALVELKKELGLSSLPRIIEGFDISNIQGEFSYSSMIHCESGRLCPSRYRVFSIKDVQGADDCSSLAEVVRRRYTRVLSESPDRVPDLILIDGGKGQVNRVSEELAKLFEELPAIVGLAKKEELLFRPGSPEGLFLSRKSAALRLLISIRDECHRFALKHHRKRRAKANLYSPFRDLPGIGQKRATLLARCFTTIDELKGVSAEDIQGKTALPLNVCEAVAKYIEVSCQQTV